MVAPWDGFVTRTELVRRYGDLTGRDMAAMPWFFALACYKLACILEGTYARAKAGQAPKETGERLHAAALLLIAKGQQVCERSDL